MHLPRSPHGRRGAAAAMFLFALTSPVGAADYSNWLAAQVGGGAGLYTGGNLDYSDPGPLVQGGLRFGWKRRLDVLASLRYGSFPAALPDSLDYYNQTTQVDLGLLYKLRPDEKWTPQAFAGAGVTFWQVVDLTGKSTGLFADGLVPSGFKEDGFDEILSDQNAHLYFGLAAEFEVFRRTSLQIGARIDWLLVQDADNTGASAAFASPGAVDANEFLSTAFLGVSYAFAERDGDQDRIPDRSDACPLQAEDADGFQDYDGCPDPDDDGDGVLDAQDRCPGTPAGAAVDSLGCPVQARPDTLREAQPDTLRQGLRRLPGGAERLSLRSAARAGAVARAGTEFSPAEPVVRGFSATTSGESPLWGRARRKRDAAGAE